MKRKWFLSGCFILMLTLFGITFMSTEKSEAEAAAINYAEKYFIEEYEITDEEVEINSIHYSEEEDRYAVAISEGNDIYEFALRLDENLDLSFILDVTGQFDEFGLAYCH